MRKYNDLARNAALAKNTTLAKMLLASIGIFLLVVSCAATQNVVAQSNNAEITMLAYPAFDGHFKYGEWLPIWIELENNGPDVDGEIQVRVSSGAGATVYVAPAHLPTISHKKLVVYVVPNNFSRELEVQLISGSQLLSSQTVPISPHPPIHYIIGIVAPQRGALALLNGIQLPGQERQKTIIDLNTDGVPDFYEGLRTFDLLIFNDIDTSTLTPEQKIALETWVAQGGRLVIGGGVGVQDSLAGLPELLQIIQPIGNQELKTLPGLEEFVSLSSVSSASGNGNNTIHEFPIRVPGPFIITAVQATDARILASQEDLPLIVEKALGNGYVDFVALDLSASPFDAWNGATRFWEKLVSPGSAYPEWLPVDMSARQQTAGQMPYTLSNLPMLDLPSAQGLALLLGLYILIVGPVNYLVLRWRKSLHWAWISIPLITTIFSIGAFSLGYILHGTDIFINKIAIIELPPNGSSGQAYVRSYLGLFSPSQRTYEIEVSGGGLLTSLNPFIDPWDSFGGASGLGAARETTVIQGDPSYIHGLSVDQWSLQSFMVEGLRYDFGQVTVQLYIEDDTLKGSVLNKSSHTITDAAVILSFSNKQVQRLGNILPGETRQVNLDLTNLSQPNFGPPLSYLLVQEDMAYSISSEASRQAEIKRIIIESMFERGASPILSSSSTSKAASPSQAISLIGWLEDAPPTVHVTGKAPAQQTTALLYMPLGYELPENGRISLPAGLMPGRLTQIPPLGGVCGEPGSTSVYLSQGEAVFEFYLPAELSKIEIDYLKLSIWADGGWTKPPHIELYDWQTLEWRSLSGLEQGVNLIAKASALVSADGLIQLRISDTETSYCYYFSMGLEGWQK